MRSRLRLTPHPALSRREREKKSPLPVGEGWVRGESLRNLTEP